MHQAEVWWKSSQEAAENECEVMSEEGDMARNESNARGTNRPNILILCMDQWQTHMQVPDDVPFPAMQRLEAQGVSFDRQYCTVPICTPSRATMWTGVHAGLT